MKKEYPIVEQKPIPASTVPNAEVGTLNKFYDADNGNRLSTKDESGNVKVIQKLQESKTLEAINWRYYAGTVEIEDGGTDYVVGDELTVSGGTGTAVTLKVTSVAAGVIDGIEILTLGEYSIIPANPVSVTGGTGNDDATFNLTYTIEQTIAITGATASSVIGDRPASESFNDYCGYGVRFKESGTDAATFEAEEAPAVDINLNLFL